MPEIKLLDKQVAELIAAGEVVERPSAVAKELCENAIDAGATSVTVEIQRGGVSYLRVTDNGCGIPRQQIPKAFLRHATSKVVTQEDLERIATLGFRGEALASVAAMCRVEMLSACEGESLGSRYVIEGGEALPIEEAGCPVGTTIVVRDIFYNTPARMKFLKKDVTEGNAVASVVEKLALSHPEIAFRLIREGEQKLKTPGDGELYTAIYSLFGREFAKGMTPLSYSRGGLSVEGYIGRPDASRASRGHQNFFINRRFIHSRTCVAALEEAFKGSAMVGKFPSCVLMLNIPLHSLDVNVHPAKTEVRFSDERQIFELVYYGCKQTLAELGNITPAPQRRVGAQVNPLSITTAPHSGQQEKFTPEQYTNPKTLPSQNNLRGMKSQENVLEDGGLVLGRNSTVPQLGKVINRPEPDDVWSGRATAYTRQRPQTNNDEAAVAKTLASFWPGEKADDTKVSEEPTQYIPPKKQSTFVEEHPAQEAPQPQGTAQNRLTDCRLVGEVLETYLILEDEGGILLVDKHAAHERVIFERLKDTTDTAVRQVLLSPIAVRLSREQYSVALENLDTFARIGIMAEDFGEGSLLIRETSVLLPHADVSAVVEEIAQKLVTQSSQITPHVLEELFHSVACRTAIKAGHKSTPEELQAIVAYISADPTLRTCPHGRPIVVELGKYSIEKMFGRIT